MTKLAIVFPGQGSQSLGMLADIANEFPEIQQTFAQATDVLGYDLWKLCQQGPVEQLDKTIYTQPALLVAGYAVWRILQARVALKPDMLAGHSLGEYTALVCADALAFTDAIKLVAARGEYMQDAVADQAGAMAAIIGLDEETVIQMCQQAAQQEIVAPANYNSVGQVVIAGHKTAVERAISLAKDQGAKLTVLLPVSVPSHCELMRPAAERLARLLTDIPFNTPKTPVISNVDVAPYTTEESIREGLIRQLFMPVRWVETIDAFSQNGIQTIVECGPGKVLTGLNKRINKNLTLISLSDLANLKLFMHESESSS